MEEVEVLTEVVEALIEVVEALTEVEEALIVEDVEAVEEASTDNRTTVLLNMLSVSS